MLVDQELSEVPSIEGLVLGVLLLSQILDLCVGVGDHLLLSLQKVLHGEA